MKIELIHPPHYNSLGDKLDVPLGLLIVASSLRKSFPDLQISINDLQGVEIKDWNIGEADVYGITVYAPSFSAVKDIIGICRTKNPNATIAIGGAHPSAVPFAEEFNIVDHVVIGAGESPMREIISFKTMNEKSPRIIEGKFDGFEFPAYDLVDLNSYCRRVDGEKSIMVITSRGCPFSCHFCGLSKFHSMSEVNFMPSDMFRDHLGKISEMGIKALNIQDDIFTLERRRLFEILAIIKEFGFKFRCLGRAGYDTKPVYEKLAESGCVQIAWGLESGSQYVLDRMNKRVTIKDNYDVVQWAKEYGITSRAFFVIGFPGETKETMDETKRFIMEADPDQYLVNNMIPYPGTAVWNDPESFGVTRFYKDFNEYYQIGKDGTGGLLSFDTQWLSRYEFKELELEFREWLKKNKKFRGSILDYEKRLYGDELKC
ncbi:MAG: radical SAM protein [Desulfobacterales bacterium]|nr:radical SAM protein [Desulfobacterales bacterium]